MQPAPHWRLRANDSGQRTLVWSLHALRRVQPALQQQRAGQLTQDRVLPQLPRLLSTPGLRPRTRRLPTLQPPQRLSTRQTLWTLRQRRPSLRRMPQPPTQPPPCQTPQLAPYQLMQSAARRMQLKAMQRRPAQLQAPLPRRGTTQAHQELLLLLLLQQMATPQVLQQRGAAAAGC